MQVASYQDFTKLQPKGLITIPKKVRTSLNFEENQLLRLKQEKGRLIIEPVRTLPYPVRTYSSKNISQFISLDEKQTKDLKTKNIL